MSKLKAPQANRAIFISIEKIDNGFVLIEPNGRKTWKASMNGVVRFLEEAFDSPIIEKDESPKTTTTVESIIKPERVVPQEKPKE